MQIFGQVWLWSLGSFLLGVLFTWLLLVNPARRRLTELEEAASRQSGDPRSPGLSGSSREARQPTKVAEPVGKETDRFLDDLFDTPNAPKPQPPILPPPMPAPGQPSAAAATQSFAPVSPSFGTSSTASDAQSFGSSAGPSDAQSFGSPSAAATQSFGAESRAADLTAPPELPTGGQDSQPQQTFAARLDPKAPPEPPIPDESDTELSDSPFRQFTESTTVFVPPADLRIPEKQERTGGSDDWFAKEEAPDPHLITDVEDDERVDDRGTIFTQHTTPIPDEMIRSLDNETPSEPQNTASHHEPQGAGPELADQYDAPAAQHQSAAHEYDQQSSATQPSHDYGDQVPAGERGHRYADQAQVGEPGHGYDSQASAPETVGHYGEQSSAAESAHGYDSQAAHNYPDQSAVDPAHHYGDQLSADAAHYGDQSPAGEPGHGFDSQASVSEHRFGDQSPAGEPGHGFDSQASVSEHRFGDQSPAGESGHGFDSQASAPEHHYGDQSPAGEPGHGFNSQASASEQHFGDQPSADTARYSDQVPAGESGHGFDSRVSASEQHFGDQPSADTAHYGDHVPAGEPGHGYDSQAPGTDQHLGDQSPADSAHYGDQAPAPESNHRYADQSPAEPAHHYSDPANTYAEQPSAAEPVHHYDPKLPEPQPEQTHRFEPVPSAHEEIGRSLFEPVVPVADATAEAPSEFVPPGPFGPGSAMPLPGGGAPAPEFNVKASVTALRYCTQDNPQFDRIVAEVWFRTPSDAERVGFRVLS